MAEIVIVEATDAFTHVAVKGRLDIASVEKVEAELTRQTAGRLKPAIVDICAVEVLGSAGVGMLIKIARVLHSHGVIFGVVATGIGKDVLERLKVDTIFPVVATYDEARSRLMLD